MGSGGRGVCSFLICVPNRTVVGIVECDTIVHNFHGRTIPNDRRNGDTNATDQNQTLAGERIDGADALMSLMRPPDQAISCKC